MSRVQDAVEEIEKMQELAVKYYDYRSGKATEIVYHDPETKEQEEKARAIQKKTSRLIYIVTACFLLMLVLTIATEKELWKILLMAAVTAVPSIFAVRAATRKLQVMTGKAVYKQAKVQDIATQRKLYYVSVIPDSGEKVIYTLIQISKEDYEKVEEGTPVLVVDQYACIL